MTQLQERPPQPSSRRKAVRRRRVLDDGQDARSIKVGLVLTLILWPLLFWLLSLGVQRLSESKGTVAFSKPSKPAFDIEFAPDEPPTPKEEPPPDRFVETNPDAPENTPDKTRNFAAQNQQVSQEKPTVNGKSDTPATEGKKDFQSNQIVSGVLAPPPELTPPPAPSSPEMMQAAAEAQARREQNPLSGLEKIVGESETGLGSNIAKPSERPSDVPEKIEGKADAPSLTGSPQLTQIKIDPQRPQPRPRIAKRARPAILADNKFGTQNIGPTAYDAKWSQYGQYLSQMFETIQVQWERIIHETRVYPPSGSSVNVKFRIDSGGSIVEVVGTQNNAGTQAERACISAITERAPYGKWTDDMIGALGESTEITVVFYYGTP